MKRISILFALLLFAGFGFAQELPTISADRPGASTGTDVMPRFKLQWETGVGFEKDHDANTFTLNNTLLRFGLFENAELRVGTDFLMFNEGEAMEQSYGISPVSIGIKTRFYEGEGFVPSIGLLTELESPHLGSKDLLPSHLTPSMALLFEHGWDNGIWVCYNVGAEWDGETATPTTFLALGFGFDIAENFGAFVETYNYLHPDEDNQYLTEFGFSWLVSRRVQLDIAGDLDFQHLKEHYAVSCGVAWLIN